MGLTQFWLNMKELCLTWINTVVIDWWTNLINLLIIDTVQVKLSALRLLICEYTAEPQNKHTCPGEMMRVFLFLPSCFSLVSDSSQVGWRPRLVAVGSFPRMTARGVAWRWEPSTSFSDPGSLLLSSFFLPRPSSSWITWHRKSWVSCWVATLSSLSSTSGSSGSEVKDKTSASSGSENQELKTC